MSCHRYAGRSLQNLTIRMDNLEEAIAQLNGKVSETCANFEDVKAYVDANMKVRIQMERWIGWMRQ